MKNRLKIPDTPSNQIIRNEKIISIIIDGIKQTLSEHTNTPCSAEEPSFTDNPNRNEIKIAGLLSLSGKEIKTTLLIGFSQGTFLNIYKNMFEQAAAQISDENQDLAGELLNIAFGIMDPEMRSLGYELTPSFPTVFTGPKLSERMKTIHSPGILVRFNTQDASFFLEIFTTQELEK